MSTTTTKKATKKAAKAVKVKLPKNANLFAFAAIALRKALKSFGKDGRYWIKGSMARNYQRYSHEIEADGSKVFESTDSKVIANYKGEHPLYMCSMGAIMRADGPAEAIAARVLSDVIEGGSATNDELKDISYELGSGQSTIIDYNDSESRKWAQIKAKFEAAIATAKLRAKVEELQRQIVKLS